jgi:hypothetical protein
MPKLPVPPGGVAVGHSVFPIFVVEGDPARPISSEGTGFVIADNVFVTCWHCVAAAPADGQRYAAVVATDDGFAAVSLNNIEQHPDGFDLAVGNLELPRQLPFELAPPILPQGADVFTYGYPLTQRAVKDDGSVSFSLQNRFLQGYVTRAYRHDPPGFPKTPAYELDMPSPEGLSGAPLVAAGSMGVVGVVYGSADSYAIAESERVDPDTGETTPEVRRVVRFGLAHYGPTLASLSGVATSSRPLSKLLT